MVPLVVTVAGLATPAAASAGRPAAAVIAAQAHAGGAGLSLPGFHAASDTVTLISGDQVTLTAAGAGRYTVAGSQQASGPGASTGALMVTAQGGPHRPAGAYAEPAGASGLIASGRVDKNLFSITRLARLETSSGSGRLPVIIQYTGAAALGSAPVLPGATRGTAPHGISDAAEYHVRLSGAAAFWQALTGSAAAAPSQPAAGPRLAKGVARVWLAGDRPPQPATAAAQDGQPAYTVTETVIGRDGSEPFTSFDCGLTRTILCTAGGPSAATVPALYGVAGAGEGTAYPALSQSCSATDSTGTCTAMQVTYSVPAGVYAGSGNGADFVLGDQSQFADLDVPQLTVTGNTSFTVNLNQAQPVTISTPQPTQIMDGILEEYRSTPGGDWEQTLLSTVYCNQWGEENYWALPSPQVTVGTFHFSAAYSLEKPQVTMTVTAPQRLTLNPWYPTPDSSVWTSTYCGAVHFSGRSTLQLVNVGLGQAQDFAGKNVRGKLVLMNPLPGNGGPGQNPLWGCPDGVAQSFSQWQLQNALQAGAAGVIVDPTGTGDPVGTFPNGPGENCVIPMAGDDVAGPVPDIPYVSISSAEATALRGMLSNGRVSISVADSGPSPYSYNLAFYQQGGIPDSLHYTVTAGQLATQQASYHEPATQPVQISEINYAFQPDDHLIGATVELFGGPVSRTEYYGPLSPDVAWLRSRTGVPAPDAWDVFDRAGSAAENWGEKPYAPGAEQNIPADVLAAQPTPGRFGPYPCAACRQGNTFWPAMSLIEGAQPPDQVYGALGQVALLPTGVHLYQNGQEIQPTLYKGKLLTYVLPPQQARYQLTVDNAENAGGAINTDTSWDFTSAEPATSQLPPGAECWGTHFGASTAPCQNDPLIFLRYNAFTNLTDSVTAAGAHQLQVTAYYQAQDHPTVTSLKLWTSTDGGTTWQPARVVHGSDGSYTAIYKVPPLSATNGYVSIKTQAADAAGNDVTQEIDDAYSIAGATSARARGR